MAFGTAKRLGKDEEDLIVFLVIFFVKKVYKGTSIIGIVVSVKNNIFSRVNKVLFLNFSMSIKNSALNHDKHRIFRGLP